MGAVIGAETDRAYTSTDIDEGRGFDVGDRHIDHDGNEWVFCYASGVSITQYDCVSIKNGYDIVQATTDNLKVAGEVGFAQVALGVNEYGWVMKTGRPTVRLAADCDKDLPLYATATGGVVDDATTSLLIQGLVATTSVTGATTAAACTANYPAAHWIPGGVTQ